MGVVPGIVHWSIIVILTNSYSTSANQLKEFLQMFLITALFTKKQLNAQTLLHVNSSIQLSYENF